MDNFDEGKKGFDSTCKVPWSSILKERKGGSFLTKLEMGRVSLPAPSKLPRIKKHFFLIFLKLSLRIIWIPPSPLKEYTWAQPAPLKDLDDRNNTFNFLILRNFFSYRIFHPYKIAEIFAQCLYRMFARLLQIKYGDMFTKYRLLSTFSGFKCTHWYSFLQIFASFAV